MYNGKSRYFIIRQTSFTLTVFCYILYYSLRKSFVDNDSLNVLSYHEGVCIDIKFRWLYSTAYTVV